MRIEAEKILELLHPSFGIGKTFPVNEVLLSLNMDAAQAKMMLLYLEEIGYVENNSNANKLANKESGEDFNTLDNTIVHTRITPKGYAFYENLLEIRSNKRKSIMAGVKDIMLILLAMSTTALGWYNATHGNKVTKTIIKMVKYEKPIDILWKQPVWRSK